MESAGHRKQIYDEISEIDIQLEEISANIAELQKQRRSLENKKLQLEGRLTNQCNENDHEEWERKEFPWSRKMDEALKNIFHLESFRPLQKATVNAVLSGQDTILLMSTGGGKSLCYQLPAVISEGLTLVVSPLISLIVDQLIQLKKNGVEAATLNHNTPKEEVKRIEDAITNKKSNFRLLYVTPEKLAKSKRIMNKLEKSLQVGFLKLIAIDEVHCCAQWGHDFRPDYQFLNILKRQFKAVPILGLTATATGNVLEGVKDMLGIKGALVFRAGFNRPNLKYEVISKPDANAETTLCSLIKERFAGQSGIVYCFSRKDCEETAKMLREKGIKAQYYHAYLEPDDRLKVHEKWLSGVYQVIVATVAFGMGIDKPDVRFVIHQSIPKSIENYYQESGRAGRDGNPAACILLWRFQDVFRQSTMVCTEKTGLPNLYSVVDYASNNAVCRRVSLSSHFDEPWEADWCSGMCDVCIDAPEMKEIDVTHIAHKAVGAIEQEKSNDKKGASGRITGSKLADVLSKNEDREVVERTLSHLLLKNYLKEAFHFTPYSIISYIEETQRYTKIKENGVSIKLSVPTSSSVKTAKKRARVIESDLSDDDDVQVTKVVKA